jgi:hypothetical protein
MTKKILKILVFFTLFYSCKSEKIKTYEKEETIQVDTLDIEQIKIETH